MGSAISTLKKIKTKELIECIKTQNTKKFKDIVEKDNISLNLLSESGFYLIHYAIIYYNSDILYILCKDRNLNLDVQDNYGGTALHIAALKNNDEAYILLKELGANDNIKTIKNYPGTCNTIHKTPYQIADLYNYNSITCLYERITKYFPHKMVYL